MFTPVDDPLTVPRGLDSYDYRFIKLSSCSQVYCIPKRRENYIRNVKNMASLSATASPDSRITSTTFSVTLAQVLPRVNNTTLITTGGGSYSRGK